MGAEKTRVFVIGSFAPSLLNFRGPLLQTLVSAGHVVHVCAPNIDATIYEKLKRIGVEAIEIPLERNGTGIIAELRWVEDN